MLVIGGDCPELDADALRSAAAAAGTHEVVLGPAGDGGYYLIGLTRPRPELFADIPWSTDGVFTATLRTTDALGLVPFRLPVRDDVDTLADLQKHAALVSAAEAPLPGAFKHKL